MSQRYLTTDLSQGEKQFLIKKCEQEAIFALQRCSNTKSPGNDGLTKDFYETFWEDLKQPFYEFVKPSKSEQKIDHISKANSNRVIRKESQL